MAQKISTRLEDLDLSQDELNRIGEALKKKEFRELLFEYAREINDPENKKQYEKEITQLENERGVDIKFVHPDPQYVLKTCFNPGGEKVFVNICSNSLVGKPTMKPSHDSKGASGFHWSIPLMQAPPREDLDKSGKLCTVYDVLFHPDAHSHAAKDKKNRTLLEDTALNAVEETFSVTLDRSSVKKPRMKYKGIPKPTVIRTRLPESSVAKEDDDLFIQQLPYPYRMPPKEPPSVLELKPKDLLVESNLKPNYITPKFILKHSSDVDMANYEQNHLSHHDITVPQRLVLIVDLPYVKSSSELELDVEQQKLLLVSTGKRMYKLELKLSYPVQATKGNAKFDQQAGKLIVTLMVDREKAVMEKYHLPEGDSGVESDMCGGRGSSGEEEEAKCAMEGASLVTDSREMEDGEMPSVTVEIKSGADVNGKCEPEKKVCSLAVSESDGLMLGEILAEKGDLSNEVLEEEISIATPNTSQVIELLTNIPEASKKENESFVIENNMKCKKITQGLLLPDVQYTVPSFSCNCLQEAEGITITFVLQAKNVDPSSVEKEVIAGISFFTDENYLKSVEENEMDEISIAPENGSVHNKYRILGVSGKPLCVTTNASTKDSVSCDVDQLGNNVPDEKILVHGAKISISNEIAENTFCDKFRDCMVMKESHVPSLCDNSMCNMEMTCIHVIFSSVGAGFFPQNFAFCVGFPSSWWSITDSSPADSTPVNIEVWDNNVELQVKKSCCISGDVKQIKCFVGKDPSNMEPYRLPPFEEKSVESEPFSDPEFSSLTSVSEDLREEGTKDESDSSGIGKENQEHAKGAVLSAIGKRKMFKERTLSESSMESITTKPASKGILKRSGRGCFGRSLSESSGGEEYSCIGSSQHFSLSSLATSSPSLTEINCIPLGESLKEEAEEYDEEEEDDDEDGEKVKKIVRFSDVISKKTYRSNASILGQRKKNQRKLKNKKRAAERRASESENSIDEVEPTSEKQNIDPVLDLSPPQVNEIPLPSTLTTMPESADPQSFKGKNKGVAKKKGNGNKGKGKKVNEPLKSDDSSGNSTSPPYEFKSDLIFQIEL